MLEKKLTNIIDSDGLPYVGQVSHLHLGLCFSFLLLFNFIFVCRVFNFQVGDQAYFRWEYVRSSVHSLSVTLLDD